MALELRSCVCLPNQVDPVLLKKPVTNVGSILLAELVAINMTIQYMGSDFLSIQLNNIDVPDVAIL